MWCYKIQFALCLLLLAAPGYGCEKNQYPDAEDGRLLVKALDRCDIAAVRRLLAQQENPVDFAGSRVAPVHLAAAQGAVEALGVMLDLAAALELRDRSMQGWTPLFFAVDWNRVEAVRYLLSRGANANAKTLHGYSVLHKAAGSHEPSLPVVQLLVKAGADVNATAPGGISILHAAMNVGDVPVVAFLLSQGADPNQLSLTKASALHYAAYDSNPQMMAVLLRYGADPAIKDMDGRLAEDIAAEGNHTAVAQLLKQSRKQQAAD